MVTTQASRETLCPVCGEANHCRIANGCLYKGPCWCEQADLPAYLLRFLVEIELEPACLCNRCLTLLADHARSLDEPTQILAYVREKIAISRPADFYVDEKGRTVFTPEYHLKRGHCCGNGCRHCPYQPIPNLNEHSV